jgi:hypothetical protein
MMGDCKHGYESRYLCPECGPAQREQDAAYKIALGIDQGPLVRPRNRHERRRLDAFLRRNPGMHPR